MFVGYTQWTLPDRDLNRDSAEVVGIASSVSEASATFSPSSPNASIDRATALMSPRRAEAYRNEFAAVAKDLTSRNISGQAQTISAGVEAIGPAVASVAVVMRGTQNAPGKPADIAVLALRERRRGQPELAARWARIRAKRSESRRMRIIIVADGVVTASRKPVSSSPGTPMRDANSGAPSPERSSS